jgi:hypothetical protein
MCIKRFALRRRFQNLVKKGYFEKKLFSSLHRGLSPRIFRFIEITSFRCILSLRYWMHGTPQDESFEIRVDLFPLIKFPYPI